MSNYSSDATMGGAPDLEVISISIPDDFPTHPNGKFSECHAAHWELYSSVDHRVPVARGGAHEMDNWVTTSMMRNLIKSHWRQEDLGWELLPLDRLDGWDGMLGWFLKYTEERADLLADRGVRDWHTAAMRAMKEG